MKVLESFGVKDFSNFHNQNFDFRSLRAISKKKKFNTNFVDLNDLESLIPSEAMGSLIWLQQHEQLLGGAAALASYGCTPTANNMCFLTRFSVTTTNNMCI
jgi:hypothetical protein